MDKDENKNEKPGWLNLEYANVADNSAVNTLVLNYYKKFGKKRDLEKHFSLSTAQDDIRDPSGQFWRRMKDQNYSSDSGGKRSESSTEVCRISIKCSAPEPSCSQDESYRSKHDSDSPPIITDDAADKSGHSDNESAINATLDTSTNKPLSPTSSVTSQRKLEWDPLADVGYANESDRKTSSSGLSTVERLALKQQYSNEDNELEIGTPTAHSTMVGPEHKGKSRKGRITEIHNKDVDVVELNMPRSDARSSINVNLTKHISFNVEKDGGITVEKTAKDVSVSPAKVSVETEVTPKVQQDKEIQTSLVKSADSKPKKSSKSSSNGAPVFISLNTLRKRIKRRRRRKRSQSRKRSEVPKDVSMVEKSGEVESEAESFEYMPGHMYNQNQVQKLGNSAGNKSSLESSGGVTTGSSNVSFAHDLEKSIELLQKILKQNQEDSNLKKQLIKDLVKKLVTTRYKDDTSTEFLSGLSLSSKRLGTDYKSTTSSTSDANNSDQKAVRPKKSILRKDKFNANALASTSQSAPNLASVSNDAPVSSNFDNFKAISSHTESDVSSKETKSSQELYNKYLNALRVEAYKKHLRSKEKLLKQKLVGSEAVIRQLVETDANSKRLRDLMKDLTRNNYDDGSGDASKLEGGSGSNKEPDIDLRKQRSHSVFTLSSNNSDKKDENDKERRKIDLRNRLQEEIEARLSTKYRPIKHHYCCCPHHSSRPIDGSIQVTIPQESKKEENAACKTNPCEKVIKDFVTCGQYASSCSGRGLIHSAENCGCKCSDSNSNQMASKKGNAAQYGCPKETNTSPSFTRDFAQPSTSRARDVEGRHIVPKPSREKTGKSQSSQTNVAVNLLSSRPSEKHVQSKSSTASNSPRNPLNINDEDRQRGPKIDVVQESTRWTQTELSILPRKAELTISDIKVINEADCAKLVSQSYREVPKPKPKEKGNGTSENTLASTNRNENVNIRSCPFYSESNKPKQKDTTKDIAIQSNMDFNDDAKANGENYTIPLKGTNMTLLVSVGSNVQNDLNRNSDKDEGINTDRVDYGEQSTLIPEEGTKAVHCQTDNIFDSPRNAEIKANPEHKSPDRNQVTFSNQAKVAIPCLSDNFRFSTYPKEQKKVMLRSNTDGRLSEKCQKEPSLRIGRDKSPVLNSKNTRIELIQTKPKEAKAAGDKIDIKNTMSSLNKNPSKSSSPRSSSPKAKDLILGAYPKVQTNETAESSLKSSKSERSNKAKPNPTLEPSQNKASDECKGDGEHQCGKDCGCGCEKDPTDPALDMIRDITRRYSKQDLEKGKRKKCFKEIMAVLNYLVDTDDSTDGECAKRSASIDLQKEIITVKEPVLKETTPKKIHKQKVTVCTATSPKRFVDKGVQLFQKKSRSKTVICDSSDHPDSSDMPTTSSDSVNCKILEQIKKECEKYHQKRCKCSNKKSEGSIKRCEGSSTTSVSCEDCKKVHYCYCRAHNPHKCKHRSKPDKVKKPHVAYNLIIQTSDSFVGEETCDNKRELKNIVFKVPSRKNFGNQNIPFNEMAAKIEEYANAKRCPQTQYKFQRSKSLPNESEVSSTDDVLKQNPKLTVRDYLEKNRPDFIANTSTRQNCLKMISESRASSSAAQRELLSVQLQRGAALSAGEAELRRLASELGHEIRRRTVAPKLISEREMKQRSESIYRALPEQRRRRDDARKENIKKTNLLMARIFKKNLQKKTLRGFVNISNYNTVIKI